MANTKSITPNLLHRINYAASIQSHFKMFDVPFCVSLRDISPCECSEATVWACFRFASPPILHAARRAVAYSCRLQSAACYCDFLIYRAQVPFDGIPFSFVHAVLKTMLDDPHCPAYHHTGQIKGYCRRNGYTIEPYDGRFGRGYRVHYPSAKASPGRHQVEYYINTKEVQP